MGLNGAQKCLWDVTRDIQPVIVKIYAEVVLHRYTDLILP